MGVRHWSTFSLFKHSIFTMKKLSLIFCFFYILAFNQAKACSVKSELAKAQVWAKKFSGTPPSKDGVIIEVTTIGDESGYQFVEKSCEYFPVASYQRAFLIRDDNGVVIADCIFSPLHSTSQKNNYDQINVEILHGALNVRCIQTVGVDNLAPCNSQLNELHIYYNDQLIFDVEFTLDSSGNITCCINNLSFNNYHTYLPQDPLVNPGGTRSSLSLGETHPNPFSQSVEIDFSDNFSISSKMLTIRNAQGQLIVHQTILENTPSYTLNTSWFPKGIYYLTIWNGDHSITSKIIKY